MKRRALVTVAGCLVLAGGANADFVINDDLVVGGSTCVGFDCVNGENFGFDTLRLKENNLRIHFDDTSNSGSFPSRDWRIVINDTNNGGAQYFGVEDAGTGRKPFVIEADARSNALYVEADGDVGFGTSNPAVNLHAVDGNTPTLRLEQDGSSGFTAQTWDLAGNETNFFIRDATFGSKLPFRIEPNAATNSIYIDGGAGNVGMGTNMPSAALHVRRTDGSAQVLVSDTNAANVARTLMKLESPFSTKFEINQTTSGNSWGLVNSGNDLRISRQGSGLVEMTIDNAGEVTIAGDLTVDGVINGSLAVPSDINLKQNIESIDPLEVLQKVTALPVQAWEYKTAPGERHIGPMAQDFHAAFGLGQGDTTISVIDSSGVALAAIQALGLKNAQLEAQNQQLAQDLLRLGTVVEALAADNQALAVRFEEEMARVRSMLVDMQARQHADEVMASNR